MSKIFLLLGFLIRHLIVVWDYNLYSFIKTSWHTGTGQSPYQALFGVTARIGLTSSNLHPDILNKLVTEEDETHVTREKEISLRAAVQNESLCAGQGFLRCNCCGTNKCQTNRSKCFKESYNAGADVTILCLVVINK